MKDDTTWKRQFRLPSLASRAVVDAAPAAHLCLTDPALPHRGAQAGGGWRGGRRGAAPRCPARRGGGNQHGHPHRATCAGRARQPPGPRAGSHTMGAAGPRGPTPAGLYGATAAMPGRRCRHSHSARRPLPRPGPCERALLAGLPASRLLPACLPTRPGALARRGRWSGASTRRKRARMRWKEGKGKAGR